MLDWIPIAIRMFQSTLSYSEKPAFGLVRVLLYHVSIPTPYRERRAVKRLGMILQSFNPHPHTGSDPNSRSSTSKRWAFQSLLPYRERLILTIRSSRQCRFNPHSRKESDFGFRWYHCLKGVSIHTPVKRVTEQRFPALHDTQVSIHTPVKRVTA